MRFGTHKALCHVSSCSLATPDTLCISAVEKNKTFFELWNEEYRYGIKTRGGKIGIDLCIIKPFK